MRKVNVLFSFLLMSLMVLTSCSLPAESIIPAQSTAESVPPTGGSILDDESRWNAVPGVDTHYVKLDDIKPGAVPEIKLGFAVNNSGCTIKETDGGFICLNAAGTSEHLYSSVIKFKPQIRKIDKEGKVIWEKVYDYEIHPGRPNNLIICPDGSFIFSVSSYPYYNGNDYVYDKSFIVKCDDQGNVIWKQDFDDYSGALLQSLFMTKDKEILAVGQWRTEGGKQVKDGDDDIVVTKLDKDGNVLMQKGFGGSDFDIVNISRYDRDLGIVINGRTQSRDGDFAIKIGGSSGDFVACIDENLEIKWVYHAGHMGNFVYDQLAIYKGFTFISGDTAKGDGTPPSGFFIKLDRDGNKVWTKTNLFSGMWGRAISALENGDIAIGSGTQNQGMIVILDQDGNEKKRLEDLKFAPSNITPTLDGGFITTSHREIKTIPQPPVISSIWYDSELVAVKYGDDYNLEWRKTYDKYKEELQGDFVLPLENGKIIVEG